MIFTFIFATSVAQSEYNEPEHAIPVEHQDKSKYDFFDWLHHIVTGGGGRSPMAAREKEFFAKHPIALQRAREIFKNVSIWQKDFCPSFGGEDPGNAVYHYIVSCYLSFHLGKKTAGEFLKIHENGAHGIEPCFHGSEETCWAKSSRMDIYNNEMGLQCGRDLKRRFPNQDPFINIEPRNALIESAKRNLRDGLFSVIEGTGNSSSCPLASKSYPNTRHHVIPRQLSQYDIGNMELEPAGVNLNGSIEIAP